MARALASLVLVLGMALAQSSSSLEEVLKALEGASKAVYVGSYLRQRTLAEGLLKAHRRGANVLLITSGYTYLDRRSYFISLWFAGVPVFLEVPDEYILDLGSRVFYGPGLGRGGPIYEASEEERRSKQAKVAGLLRRARVFPYSPQEVVRLLLRR